MNKYERIVKINWAFENYLYSNSFSIDRIGFYNSKVFLNKKELTTPEKLFKFYGTSKYTLEALKNQYLYFSSPRDFNDPFDCMTNRESYIMKGGKGITEHRNSIGVCCFTLTNENPLMWGHYTNNYQGICIKFKNKKLLKNKNVAIKSHVSYLKNYQPANNELNQRKREIDEFEISQSDKDFIKKILTMLFEYCWKYYDWKYEKEYRAISFGNISFNRKLSFEIEDVEEIYIGNRLEKKNPEFYKELISVLKNNYSGVKLFKVKPNPLVIKLEFEEFNI
ncbi:DUF2971 domain-containing protein [Mesoflavibacter profundi]|uniref:DUF2971 domain-containing protein n=1 Tax=Mesoflavibacter profundi TaxID=2708110 RepID=A0ABT4RWR0_9FLAO|nr:DUF2971 domain-containing protein [Mesoflavibacter profundi]MDA0176068.1 DUF2971 domain-containing protein [Mesoflavibacter profundi]